jgi:hypothetical protein
VRRLTGKPPRACVGVDHGAEFFETLSRDISEKGASVCGRAGAFSSSTCASSWADPRCSISREPRCEEYTICTAVAPDAVFTVRTYGTR